MITQFFSPDIECGGCAASIRKALTGQPGIETVAVDVEAQIVTVTYNDRRVQPHEIVTHLNDIGFGATPAVSAA